jgi:hypothetical protein
MSASVVRSRDRDARRDHVAVADGLDLLELVLLGERVEVAEQVVQHAHHRGRRQVLGAGREVHDIGEED